MNDEKEKCLKQELDNKKTNIYEDHEYCILEECEECQGLLKVLKNGH